MKPLNATMGLPIALLVAVWVEAEADARARADAPGCASVRVAREKWSQLLSKRVQAMRAARQTALKAGKPDPNDQGEYVRLMNDIEQAERRFAARNEKCVGG